MPDPHPLLEAAAAIADGAPVDWSQVPATDAHRLQRLEQLVRSHEALRSLDSDDDAPAPKMTILTEARASAEGSSPLSVRWGPLIIQEKLGRGSFGDVYRAWDPRTDREVALKLIPEPRSGAPSSPAIDEARQLARVTHPNVVTVFGAERVEGRVGIWMQYVRGTTLESEVTRRGPLPVDEIIGIGRQLAGALQAVHASGLVHRDVKAQNALRDASGRILLGDFGTSVDVADGRDADAAPAAGTPLYLAPEVLAGRPATPASDLYGLGVLLYHLASGAYPVTGRSLAAIRRAHEAGERTALAARRPALPAELTTVVDALLETDPAHRPVDAHAVERALEHAARRGDRLRGQLKTAAVGSVVMLLAVAAVWAWLRPAALSPGAGLHTISDPLCSSTVARSGWMACVPGPTDPTRPLVLFEPLTGRTRELVKPPGQGRVLTALVSPDGLSVAYTLLAPDSGFLPDRVRVQLIDSGDDRLVSVLPTDVRLLELRAWSPGGDGLEFYLQRSDESYAVARLDFARDEFDTMIDFPGSPQGHATSPDGRLIAFDVRASDQDARDVRVCDLLSRECWSVAPHPADDFIPFWAPDGSRLYFNSSRGGTLGLWRIAMRDGRSAGLPELVTDLGRAQLRPRGFDAAGSLFFVRWNVGPDVVTTPVALAGPPIPAQLTRLSPSVTSTNTSGVWSPDGSRVAYVTQRRPFSDAGAIAVVVQSADDGAPETGAVLLEKPLDLRINASRLAWSPNGERLALDSVIGNPLDNRPGIHILDATTGEVVRSVRLAGYTGGVGWLDDRTVAYFTRSRVGGIDIETDDHQVIWRRTGDESVVGVRVSPDLRRLALTLQTRDRSSTRIIVVPVSGGPEITVLEAGSVFAHDWLPSGAELLVAMPSTAPGAAPGTYDLNAVPIDRGSPRGLVLGIEPPIDVRVHPDGRSLVLGLRGRPPTLEVARGIER